MPWLIIALPFRGSGVMNRRARITRQKDKSHEDQHRKRRRQPTQPPPLRNTARTLRRDRRREERRSQEEGCAQGPETRQGCENQNPPKKRVKAAKKPRKAGKATTPRAESKGAKILDLIRRPKGAILAEIMKATDWQAHSVRGFLSTAAKKHNIKIQSEKTETGERIYRIAK